MIVYLVGTKAQLIKMAPVILETSTRHIPFKLVYTGQHSETFSDLQKNFGLPDPDMRLYSLSEATNRQSFLGWALSAWRAANSDAVRDIWQTASAIVVHGDTASTLLGARLARRYGRPLVHIEAGLRSFNYLHPFPEELIRVLVSRSATLHCCPDELAVSNLEQAGIGGQKLLTCGNTLIDSLRLAGASTAVKTATTEEFGLFSMHRHENLFNKKRFNQAIALLKKLAEVIPMRFVMHPVTERRLSDLGLLSELQRNNRIALIPRMDFFDFHKLMRNARFVITDGGSNQEECALLSIPCALIRRVTERQDGLGKNVLLADLNMQRILSFVDKAMMQNRQGAALPNSSPSKIIVDHLESFINETSHR